MQAVGITWNQLFLYSMGYGGTSPDIDPNRRFEYLAPFVTDGKQFLLLTATGENYVFRLAWAGFQLPEIAGKLGTSLSVLRNTFNKGRFERAVRLGRISGNYWEVKAQAKKNNQPGYIGRLAFLNIRFGDSWKGKFSPAIMTNPGRETEFLRKRYGPKTAPRKLKKGRKHAHPEQWKAGQWIPNESTKKKHRRRSRYDGHLQQFRPVGRSCAGSSSSQDAEESGAEASIQTV